MSYVSVQVYRNKIYKTRGNKEIVQIKCARVPYLLFFCVLLRGARGAPMGKVSREFVLAP